MDIENLKKNYKCLIFDCDGTLAHTMPAHCEAYKYAFKHYNIPFTKSDFYTYAPAGGKILLEELIINRGYNSKYAELIKEMKSEIVGDFLDKFMIPNNQLINLIKDNTSNFKMCVVSNGRRKSILTILDKLNISQHFYEILTAENYIASKPYPEPYVLAYKKIGVHPKECLVFEDNDVGRLSAKNAGLDVIMVDIINSKKIKLERG